MNISGKRDEPMATDKPRFSISMDEKTFEKVIAYKKEKGMATQNKAVIKIMEIM